MKAACSTDATDRSATTLSECPPPAAHPGTAAMTAFGIERIRRCTSRMWSRPALAGSTCSRLRPVSAEASAPSTS